MTSTKSSEYEDLIDRLAKASLELKATIKEAHQASRDLKEQTREARTALSKEPVEELIGNSVTAQLEAMVDTLQKSTHQTYERVIRQFDVLTKPLLQGIDDINEHLKLIDLEIAQRQRIVRELP